MRNHRLLAIAGMTLFGALLLGTPHAAAAPAPGGPTDVVAPTVPPEPPTTTKPTPQFDPPATDIVAERPCWQLDNCPPPECPEDVLCPVPVDPCLLDPKSCDEPSEPSEPTEPATVPTPAGQPVDQPRPTPEAVPTPTRIDTGAGPAEPVNWWLIAVPALALLAMAAAGTFLWIARSERRSS